MGYISEINPLVTVIQCFLFIFIKKKLFTMTLILESHLLIFFNIINYAGFVHL